MLVQNYGWPTGPAKIWLWLARRPFGWLRATGPAESTTPDMYVLSYGCVAICMCCYMHVAICICCHMHVLPYACVAICMCCRMHALPYACDAMVGQLIIFDYINNVVNKSIIKCN